MVLLPKLKSLKVDRRVLFQDFWRCIEELLFHSSSFFHQIPGKEARRSLSVAQALGTIGLLFAWGQPPTEGYYQGCGA